jgi:hypothetical protein
MKVGDILVCINDGGYVEDNYTPYTKNKHYVIYKIDHDFIPEHSCGYIKDDYGDDVYFREDEASDNNWKYLKELRKEKLLKIETNN